MKAVKVQYTVKPEYAETNKSNIAKVMDKLKASPIEGMNYASFVLDDGVSFVHINFATDQETMNRLQELPEFNAFREALKASGPVSPPKSENLSLVGAGYNIL